MYRASPFISFSVCSQKPCADIVRYCSGSLIKYCTNSLIKYCTGFILTVSRRTPRCRVSTFISSKWIKKKRIQWKWCGTFTTEIPKRWDPVISSTCEEYSCIYSRDAGPTTADWQEQCGHRRRKQAICK